MSTKNCGCHNKKTESIICIAYMHSMYAYMNVIMQPEIKMRCNCLLVKIITNSITSSNCNGVKPKCYLM